MRVATQQSQSAADRVTDDAIRHALFGTDPVVIAKSPPGAGKTFLVECAAVFAASELGMRVLIVTPGVSQAYDIALRLSAYDIPRLELVHATHRNVPPFLVDPASRGRLTVANGWDNSLNQGPGVLIANAHVPSEYRDRLPVSAFDLMNVDEAWQLAAIDFMPIGFGSKGADGRRSGPAPSGNVGGHGQSRGGTA
jgi:hypothetical protein